VPLDEQGASSMALDHFNCTLKQRPRYGVSAERAPIPAELFTKRASLPADLCSGSIGKKHQEENPRSMESCPCTSKISANGGKETTVHVNSVNILVGSSPSSL